KPAQAFRRGHSPARQDIRAIRGGGVFAQQPKAVDEIVDVGEMVIDFAAAQREPPAPGDAAKQPQQPAVPRAVDPGWPRDRYFNPTTRARRLSQALAFELGFLVDVTGFERCVLIRRRPLDVSVHTDGAAVD